MAGYDHRTVGMQGPGSRDGASRSIVESGDHESGMPDLGRDRLSHSEWITVSSALSTIHKGERVACSMRQTLFPLRKI